ncbi:hypothetical protein AUEXF2481DRAFT_45143 [Aureobasidium subglaciale EXF-2481]|uniref:DUF7029 domain-containing protein n=1 Tax=Aureobasidium subglaciale (strain EXF-2481) TaxID=1043005 RepID=A0A074XXU6_AURSE|nr:uncharacterized protein AUEXF2481DRAFT_45143 [Aureobasidium subglaciale EXF-2481]KEQ90398.1 hypothetical protein AUEXF2481DRAFT_45143 [Aureobasidium subglaciale EXF-2481]
MVWFTLFVAASLLRLAHCSDPNDQAAALPTSRTFLPARDWTINHREFSQLDTTTTATLMFMEEPSSSMAMSTTMDMIYQTLILENSAYVNRVVCSSSSSSSPTMTNIEVSFRNEHAFERSSHWPEESIVLITNSKTCNPRAERGVFLTKKSVYDAESLCVRFEALAVTWTDVANTMAISYLELEQKDSVMKIQT